MTTTIQRYSLLACIGLIGLLTAFNAHSGTVAFNYDLAGRLTTANYAPGKSINHTYDPGGNLLQRLMTTDATNPDEDGDGMDDAWEILYFQTRDRDGVGDFDNDNFADLSEFLAGTLPDNLASYLRILSTPVLAGIGATIRWQAVPGKTYRLQFKDSLADPNWADLPGDILAENESASKTDPSPNTQPHRFYRIKLVP